MANRNSAGRQPLRIDEATFRDKVLGCWLGKNAGGTLGGPLEQKFGREEVFEVSWYTDLPEGGIPNDDLEMQLIWFQALKERGPGITSRDLVEYWIDCVAYNFDEYGLSKTNMVKGLAPPVCGWHNNWFKHCMGSPIRSEIWACIAPGVPDLAARYAFEDAICDHAGGESVYGEVFNAVVESSAFFISDTDRLLELGLKAIPESSLTHRAVRMAMDLYKKGVDWKVARNTIKDKFYVAVAQYSPINLGYQTIGLLYGKEFGEAICTAVNCGWDTDCTAATIGALIGIIQGASRLPEKWMKPLGTLISTNLSTGGIRNLRAPTDINELTDQVCAMAKRVLKYWDAEVEIVEAGSVEAKRGPQAIEVSLIPDYEPNRVSWNLGSINASVCYLESAAAMGDRPVRFEVEIENPHPDPIRAQVTVTPPARWLAIAGSYQEVEVPAHGKSMVPWSLKASSRDIQDSNTGTIEIAVERRPSLCRVPLTFLGGNRWLVSPLFEGKGVDDGCGVSESSVFAEAPRGWREIWREGNELRLEELFGGKPGVMYLLHCIKSEREVPAIIGVSNNSRMIMWLNGGLAHRTKNVTPIRPNQGNGGGDGSNYLTTALAKGWNQVLIKVERKGSPIEGHFTLGMPDAEHPKCLGHAILGLHRASYAWE